MATSKYQKHQVVKCVCGCDENFKAFPIYRNNAVRRNPQNYKAFKTPNTTLYVPQYRRGHSPNCVKNQTQNKPTWNRGLTKCDHPSIKKMGFQPLHRHNEVPARSAALIDIDLNNLDFFSEEFTPSFYTNIYNLTENPKRTRILVYSLFTEAILKRDKHTCQNCKKQFKPGQDRTGKLYIHHKIPREQAPDRIIDHTNVILLCPKCHGYIHKLINKQNAAR